ncbi:MAG: hypothetical protein ABSG42_06665 [Nitrospirota bacterium]
MKLFFLSVLLVLAAALPGRADEQKSQVMLASGGDEEAPFVQRGEDQIRKKDYHDSKTIILDEGKTSSNPIASKGNIIGAGFIHPEPLVTLSMKGTSSERDILTLGDQVYMADDGKVSVGDRLVSGRPILDAKEPETGRSLGKVIDVSGVITVTAKKDGVLIGTIDSAFFDVRTSDLLFPYVEPVLVYEPVPFNTKLKGVWGYIVASRGNEPATTTGDVLYIDMGYDKGVMPGDRFSVRRSGGTAPVPEGQRYEIPKAYVLPDVKVGEVQVISVRKDTATLQLLSATEPVLPGFRVYYK